MFHVLQLLSYFKTLFETKRFMCCVRRVKYIFHFTQSWLCFFLCLFPFVVSHVAVLILPMSFCVQHVFDNRRIYVETNQILIILPTQGKKHILQGLCRRSDCLIHLHGLSCMATLYSILSESSSGSVFSVYQPKLKLEPQFPSPNRKPSGSFGVYGGHSVFC